MRTRLLPLLLVGALARAHAPDGGTKCKDESAKGKALAPHKVEPFSIKHGKQLCTGDVTIYELGCFITQTSEEFETDAGYEIYDLLGQPESLECGEKEKVCGTTITCRCLKTPKKR